MGTTTMKCNKRNRQSRNRRGRGGYSFAEGLIALMIVLLVTNGMVAGVEFAMREYRESMILSESRVLCSTLTDIINDELSNTPYVNPGKTPLRYFSHAFAKEGKAADGKGVCFISMVPNGNSESADGYGEICVGYKKDDGSLDGAPTPVISYSAYSSYHLTAKVEVDCDLEHSLFHVTLRIRPPYGEDMVTTFDVLSLYELEEDPDL